MTLTGYPQVSQNLLAELTHNKKDVQDKRGVNGIIICVNISVNSDFKKHNMMFVLHHVIKMTTCDSSSVQSLKEGQLK